MIYDAPQLDSYQKIENVRESVREAYGKVAEANNSGKCCGNGKTCCGVSSGVDVEYSLQLGYTLEDLENSPNGANMSLGCGNPQVIAKLKQGEYVLDLGAGGGFDVFLAAPKVGPTGKVYGVDMTPEMVKKARYNAIANGYKNVEFLLGEIEHLPLPNSVIDVIISNCVVNLSTDKLQVFKEAYRVLKEGGRLAISDVVANKPLPKNILNDKDLYCACISGALSVDELKDTLRKAGFEDVVVDIQENSKMFIKEWAPEVGIENYVVSAKIMATKKTK